MMRRFSRRELGCLRLLASFAVEASHGGHSTLPLLQRSTIFQDGTVSSRPFSSCGVIPRQCGFVTLSGAASGGRTFSSEAAEEQVSDGVLGFRKIVQVCEVLEEVSGWNEETAKLLGGLDMSYTSDMVVRVVTSLSSPDVALGFFNWLTVKGFEQDAETYVAIIDALGASGSLDNMKRLAEEMRQAAIPLDARAYDVLMRWCVHHGGNSDGALSLIEQMKQEGIAMTALTYTNMFDLYVKEGKYDDAVTLYLQMVEEGVVPVPRTVTSLIQCLLDAGKLDPAQTIFTSLSGIKVKPPMSAYAYLMSAHAKVGNSDLLQSLGKEMRNAYSRPGNVFCSTLASLFKQGNVQEADVFAKEVWPNLSVEARRLKGQDFVSVPYLNEDEDDLLQGDLAKLLNSRVRISLSETARLLESEGLSSVEQLNVEWTSDAIYKVLKQIRQSNMAWDFFRWLKSVPSFEHDFNNEVLMLRALVKDSNFSAFKELLCDLQTRNVDIPMGVFNMLINDCAIVKNAEAAMWVYSRLKESSLQPDEETFSLLVQAFARGKNPDKASDLCAVMLDLGIKPDVETFTAVIHSLGLAGRSDDAWSVYQKMLATGLKPNAHTYTALLNMMNLVGDTGFAIKLYKEMNASGVAPTEATQGIMSKIWEASGNSAEAEKVDTQRRFLSSKRKEDTLQRTYEVLLEGLVEEARSPSLLAVA